MGNSGDAGRLPRSSYFNEAQTMNVAAIFQSETSAETLVIVPQENVGSLADARVQPELQRLLATLETPGVKHVVVDFSQIDYFGSSMLEALLRLWKHVHAHQGHMAVCNVSAIGREVLQTGRFDTLWEVHDSREAALQAVAG